MNIVVCVKIVQGEINPFDGAALEAALRLDAAQTTVLCMGPKNVVPVLKTLTRTGDFRTILLSDDLYAGSDTLATSYALSRAVRKLEADLVFCGRQTIDGETAQVGPCLATMLGIPFIGNVMRFGQEECVTRNGKERVSLPSLLTFERIHPLRFPSLNIPLRDLEIWDNNMVGADPKRCGLAGSPTRVMETFESESGRRNCRFIERKKLEPLLEELLRGTVIALCSIPAFVAYPAFAAHSDFATKIKFAEIHTVGDEVYEQAAAIAENVVVLPKTTAEGIAETVRKNRPEILLWNADLWARNTAPQVAALLETGLCADCTALQVSQNGNEKTLDMFRPALGGNVIARIRCRTRPVMATVRVPQVGGGLIVGCGRGVADCYEKARRLAENFGAEICASRGLVDRNVAPYEIQVGLTGKHVSPDVYLALGISGSVQHLCAVETARTIIAVNPDRHARIFDYADYGIIDKF